MDCAAASAGMQGPFGGWFAPDGAIAASDGQTTTTPSEGPDARTATVTDGAFDGPILGVAATGDLRIDGVLSGVKWDLTTLTFSFPDQATDYEPTYNRNAPLQSFGQISATQQALFRLAMDGANYISIEGFTLLQFTDNGVSGDSTIRAAYSTDAGGSAYAYYPSPSYYGGDMWFGPTSGYNYANSTRGGHGWRSSLHELGHAMGLKHAHEGQGPGLTAVPAAFDHHEYTVMSYRSYQGHGANGYTNETWGTPQSFMMLDIAALQYMYGADFSFNGGASVYTFSPTTGEMFINGVGQGAPGGNRIFQTIWDGNGVDTFNLSNYTTNLQIDLAPGAASLFSSAQQARLGSTQYARGNVYNALLYNGDLRSLIENATGGTGADTIRGNQGDNELRGGDGDDLIGGRDGDDWIYGENGVDALYGANGDDFISGGAGNDTLDGFNGTDRLSGGADDDTLNGGDGDDSIVYLSSPGAVVVDLLAGTVTGGAGNDTLVSIEEVFGSTYNDTIRGDGGANTLHGENGDDLMGGRNGDDLLDGGNGDDKLYGANGDDILYGGAGSDYLDGFSGEDTATYIGSASAVVVDLAAGTATGGAGSDTLVSIERVLGSIAGDTIRGDGGANKLYGHWGDDLMGGRDGDDFLDGGDGHDSLYGANGDDVLLGGWGNDYLDGFAGQDTASYAGAAGSVTVDLLAGTATGAAGNDTLSSIERAFGSSHNDTIRGDGSANQLFGGDGDDLMGGRDGSDLVNGENGNDSLYGANGDDTLNGGNGNDYLDGFAGADTLNGDNGVDTLFGGADNDTLTGGAGGDTFVFRALSDSRTTASDVITDFNSAQGDRIDISAIDANGALAGDQAFVVQSSGPQGVAGQAWSSYNGGTNRTSVFLDVDGDNNADFILLLTGNVSAFEGAVL